MTTRAFYFVCGVDKSTDIVSEWPFPQNGGDSSDTVFMVKERPKVFDEFGQPDDVEIHEEFCVEGLKESLGIKLKPGECRKVQITVTKLEK